MRVAEGVYSLGQIKGGRVHAYLFEQPRELTLVDTLWDAEPKLVLDCIRRLGRSPASPSRSPTRTARTSAAWRS